MRCGKKQKRFEKVGFHRFPRNVAVRQKWLEFCGVAETEIRGNPLICDVSIPKCERFPSKFLINISYIYRNTFLMGSEANYQFPILQWNYVKLVKC